MSEILDLSAAAYHDDQIGDRPSLSRSIAHLLCSSSPAHARHEHPRLNPNFVRKESDDFDLGTAAHELFLGGEDRIAIVDAKDWRTNAAKDEREEARAAGKLPILANRWESVQEMVAAIREQIDVHQATPKPFTDGKAEQTLVWTEPGDVVCRARADWLRDDHTAIDDLKTTGRTANPEAFSRSLFGSGYDIQAAFYTRGACAVLGVAPEFRFVVAENTPPFALSVVALGPAAMTIAQKKVQFAIDLWRRCVERDEWPAYPDQVCWASLPPWEEERWLAKEEREMVA